MKRKPIRRLSQRMRDSIAARQGWARAIKERDGCCQAPGCGETEAIEAHHVHTRSRYPELRLVMDNGLCMCVHHHREWHRNTRLWKQWFSHVFPERDARLKSLLAHSKSERVRSFTSASEPAERSAE